MKLIHPLLLPAAVFGLLGNFQASAQATNSAPITAPALVAGAGKLMDMKLQSRDRMFLGEIKILPTWKHVSLRVLNRTTGEDFGTYRDVLETMTTSKHAFKIYDHQSDMFSAQDMADAKTDPAVTQQPVVFFKDDQDPTILHFSSTSDAVGTIEVQVTRDGKQFAYSEHKLVADPEFSSLIDATDKAISGPAPAASTNSP